MSAELIQKTRIARPNFNGLSTRTEMLEGLFINLAENLTLNDEKQLSLLSLWINQITTETQYPYYFWTTEDNETWKPVGVLGTNVPKSHISQ